MKNKYFALQLSLGVIHVDITQDLINLREIFDLSGKDRHYRPVNWLALESTQELLAAALTKLEKVEISDLLEARRGRTGGTWAHRTIAMAYASYLDPNLMIEMSEAYMKYRSADLEMALEIVDNNLDDDQKIWMGARLISKKNEKTFRKIVKAFGCSTPEQIVRVRHALRDGLFGMPSLREVTNTPADEIVKDHMDYQQNILEALAMDRLENLLESDKNLVTLRVTRGDTTRICAAVKAIGTQVRMGVGGVQAKQQIPSIKQMYDRNLKVADMNTL